MDQSTPDPEAAARARRFAEMLEKPPMLPDPVFPKLNYLPVFGRSFFTRALKDFQRPELISIIRENDSSLQQVMFTAGWLAFWAFDFEVVADQGRSGRDLFLDRVKEPIRRPPTHLAAFTAERHLVARGVLNIQIPEESSDASQYELCQLKTIGWYVAQLVPPQ